VLEFDRESFQFIVFTLGKCISSCRGTIPYPRLIAVQIRIPQEICETFKAEKFFEQLHPHKNKKDNFSILKRNMIWKCFEGPMAAQHTRCDNDRNTNECGDQVSLLGWESTDYKEQRNPAYFKEATQVEKLNPSSSSQNPLQSRPALVSLVDKNQCKLVKGGSSRSLRSMGASSRSLRSMGSSCRALCLGSKSASNRSLYRGMTDENNGEPGIASDPSDSTKANDASPSVLSNQSFGDDAVLNEKVFLVENQSPPVARKISYLQLEIYLACDVVEDDAESGWAFKTPTTNVESGPHPPTSVSVQMRAVWCL
jgi:hypothetical protein